MNVLRTPDSAFDNLPGYPFAPHYLQLGEQRMHYVDEGRGPVVLMLHGEPTWSFLYRKMIPVFVAAGFRAIAPDLIGFGRSEKPEDREAYTFASHVAWMKGFIEGLDLKEIGLFGQDWGGLIGLRLAAENVARFAKIVASNTFLPTGDQRPPDAFFAWQKFSQELVVFPTGKIVAAACATPLTPDVIAAYDAPFPEEKYKAGARHFPLLVPTRPDDPAAEANRRAWEVLRAWKKPFLTIFGAQDPITRGAEKQLQKAIPGAAGQPHAILESAGHFIQEDAGDEVARLCAAFFRA